MSECKTSKNLSYSDLVNMDIIQEVIKGITIFNEAKNFYILLNACVAGIDKNEKKDEYNLCLNENLIVSANNNDNLIKLVENIVDNIYKEDKMRTENKTEGYTKYQLLNTSYFNQMELIFYQYIIPVGDIFAKLMI